MPSPIALNIHGDNIIECERALTLIADSFTANTAHLPSAPYLPRYEIRRNGRVLFTIGLFSGHNRWNVDLQQIMQSNGAPLREATDAVITRVSPDGQHEEIVLAFEFCNALPAGNNAWQRNGRAIACAIVGVPYLFFAEVGGVELGAERRIKAPRFPNPLVPFSYLAANQTFDVVCLPVYAPSPSSTESIRARFASVFGIEDARSLVRRILENASIDEPRVQLIQRGLTLVETLAEQRQSIDTLRGEQWKDLLKIETAKQKTSWLLKNKIAWTRKQAGKVAVTNTFRQLPRLFQDSGCISAGAKDIPICLVPGEQRGFLASQLKKLYGETSMEDLSKWIARESAPLVVVWITGFKPRGDDSRPDRGLVPLARMLFGNDVDILSIVHRPAKSHTWQVLRESPQRLAQKNGLWEAIINLSDAVLLDSTTTQDGAFALLLQRSHSRSVKKIRFATAAPTGIFSEHDVDCALHTLFAQHQVGGIFEAICNPPGGDWSGLSILDFQSGVEYRWTSLPRVSGAGGKRPDHVIQFLLDDRKIGLLAIESKSRPTDLESGVGVRLKAYTRQLVKMPPVILRTQGAGWQLGSADSTPLTDVTVISGGAFCWNGEPGLDAAFKKGKLDVVFAFEFKSVEQASLLHIKVSKSAEFVLPVLENLLGNLGGRLEIQIH